MKPALASDLRAREIQLCAIARAELIRNGVFADLDTARDVMQSVTGQRSTSDMDWTQRKRWLDHLKKLGFKVKSNKGKPAPRRVAPAAAPQTAPAAAERRTLDQSPEGKKARALWLFLHKLGAVKNPSEAALQAYTKRIAKVDTLQWADKYKVIETLKKWAMRFLPATVEKLLAQVRQLPLTDAQRRKLNNGLDPLSTGQGFDAHWSAYEALAEVIA